MQGSLSAYRGHMERLLRALAEGRIAAGRGERWPGPRAAYAEVPELCSLDSWGWVQELRSAPGVILSCTLPAAVGDQCCILTPGGREILAEVIGFNNGLAYLVPYEQGEELSPGMTVVRVERRRCNALRSRPKAVTGVSAIASALRGPPSSAAISPRMSPAVACARPTSVHIR